MNPRRSFYRKVAYIVAIVALLVPLSWLSMPSSGAAKGAKARPGGKLAQLRKEHQLSQANLGEIDPASETMKLATLGMRGIAANILWEKANYYKKTENWTALSATLEQITKLQPNFITVWQFQAWNLSYNVSVEFDDYRDRYRWVKRGINYLKEGEKYNENNPRILWDIGWFIGQKIGRADEHKQFRKLFEEDDDFHPPLDQRTRGQRDNWLVAREWFLKGQDAVLKLGKSLKGKSPLIFHSDSAMSLMNYAEALEEDGTFGEKAKQAWKNAAEAWDEYGALSILHTTGMRIRLNDEERIQAQADELSNQLAALLPGVREELVAERRAELTEEQLAALETPEAERTPQQLQQAALAEQQLKVSDFEVTVRIREKAPEKAEEAERLRRLAEAAQTEARNIDRYRDNVNFEYWRMRCEFEQTADALAARELIYLGDQALLERAAPVEARKLYEQGMAKWRAVYDKYPLALEQGATGDDLIDVIIRYRDILRELDEEFPQDFILRDVVETCDREGRLSGLFTTADEISPRGEPKLPPLPTDGRPPEPPADAEEAAKPAGTKPAAAPTGTPNELPADGRPPEPPAGE
jgi:hypothetical protein